MKTDDPYFRFFSGSYPPSAHVEHNGPGAGPVMRDGDVESSRGYLGRRLLHLDQDLPHLGPIAVNHHEVVPQLRHLGQPSRRFVGASQLLIHIADVPRLPESVTAERHQSEGTDERLLGGSGWRHGALAGGDAHL